MYMPEYLFLLFAVYLIMINMAGFALMGRDKTLAKKNGRRIPEKKLLAVSAAGGAAGALAGMRVFRHKIKHVKFALGLPVILVTQLAVLILIWEHSCNY